MISKKNKLTRISFPKFSDPQKRWSGEFLSIQYTKKQNKEENTAFAVVIPKKTLNLAVKRNELKREIYDVASVLLDEFSKNGISKVVIMPNKSKLPIDRASIKESIQIFLESI